MLLYARVCVSIFFSACQMAFRDDGVCEPTLALNLCVATKQRQQLQHHQQRVAFILELSRSGSKRSTTKSSVLRKQIKCLEKKNRRIFPVLWFNEDSFSNRIDEKRTNP